MRDTRAVTGRRHWARGMVAISPGTVPDGIRQQSCNCDSTPLAAATLPRMSRLPHVLVFACLLLAALAPASQARTSQVPYPPSTTPVTPVAPIGTGLVTTTIGVADQSGATFSDPLFSALGVRNARLNLAWDAMEYDWQLAELDNWMNAAHAAGVTPLVIFSQSRVPGKTRLLPTSAQFSQVVDKLRARYPYVTDFAAWNEANHAGQPSYKKPAAVAAFYKILKTKCPTCNVLPASLLDNPNLVPWTLQLRKAILKLGMPDPRIWGLHNYSDVNRLKDTSTRALLAAVKGKVWITESGGVVYATSPTASKFPQGEAYAGKVAKFILGPLIRANPRIDHVFFYNWKPGGTSQSWDSGLVSEFGQPRAAYQVIKASLRGGVVRNKPLAQKKVKLRTKVQVKRGAKRMTKRAGKRR